MDTLKMPVDLFSNTDKTISKLEIMEVGLENLQHFKNHPFKLYTGQRFIDMVKSIKENGLINPIIVRPTHEDNTRYEILSGHNRYEASKLAGLHTISSIIKRNLTEDEAYLVVTESNLIQRSFADLIHSERALILATHYEAIKKQGKRSDFIKEIENEIKNADFNADKPHGYNENSTCCPVGTNLKSSEKTAEQYGLSARNVARYLRINKLIELLKSKIDNDELSVRAGVSLSYLSEVEQNLVVDFMDENNLKIDIKKAEQLREYSEIKKLAEKTIEEVFLGKKIKNTSSKPTNVIKIKRKKYERFFSGKESQIEIEETFEKALDFYFRFKDSNLSIDIEKTQSINEENPNDYVVDEMDNVKTKIKPTKATVEELGFEEIEGEVVAEIEL